jgi:hypothetical protein
MAAYPRLHTVQGSISRADLNSGLTIVKPRDGRSRIVVDAWLRAIGGDVKTATAIKVTDTTSGTTACSFATAAMTVAAGIVRIGASNTTATNLLAQLGGGEGLKLSATGTLDAQTTSMDYCVKFVNV